MRSQKVEIVVTSNRDPDKVAKLVRDEMLKLQAPKPPPKVAKDEDDEISHVLDRFERQERWAARVQTAKRVASRYAVAAAFVLGVYVAVALTVIAVALVG